jgi:DNA topoisomerase IA
MKTLIIAEKPSVAADLARSLGKIPKSGDHYENDEYVISSAVGHLVELEMPEDIDKKKYGFWRLEMLPHAQVLRRSKPESRLSSVTRRYYSSKSSSCSKKAS